ncbi:hypothetical protein PM082_014808 [Marasmius tenuissimus]|nr:hypothetical protein PM082_014808 [Marasmius tenuissimus]
MLDIQSFSDLEDATSIIPSSPFRQGGYRQFILLHCSWWHYWVPEEPRRRETNCYAYQRVYGAFSHLSGIAKIMSIIARSYAQSGLPHLQH